MDERIAELQGLLDSAVHFLARVSSGLSEVGQLGLAEGETIERVGTAPPFSFPWPGKPERYSKATTWRIRGARGSVDVTVGHGRRRAWGRDRRRVVVFGPPALGVWTRYPSARFHRDGSGADVGCVRPDPSRPRRILRDGDALPHYENQTVARADELLGSIRTGASLASSWRTTRQSSDMVTTWRVSRIGCEGEGMDGLNRTDSCEHKVVVKIDGVPIEAYEC